MWAEAAVPQLLPAPRLGAAVTLGAGGLAEPQGRQPLHGSKAPGMPTHWGQKGYCKNPAKAMGFNLGVCKVWAG